MKKISVVVIILFGAVFGGFAQPAEERPCEGVEKAFSVKDYQKLNVLAGFGIGSRKQGDAKTANWLLASDITGITLIAGGTAGLILGYIIYDGLRMMYGNVTTADLWISGSVLTAGCALFAGGRTAAYFIPLKFEENHVQAEPLISFGSSSISAGLSIRF